MRKIMVVASLAGALVFVALPAAAMMKMNPVVAHKALNAAASRGAHIFAHDTFGGHRRMQGMPVTCESCHMGGGRVAGRMPNGRVLPSLVNAAAIFPHYNPMSGTVVTLQTQIRKCVKGAIGGHPPAYGSAAMTDMVAYLHAIAKGQPINPGGMPK